MNLGSTGPASTPGGGQAPPSGPFAVFALLAGAGALGPIGCIVVLFAALGELGVIPRHKSHGLVLAGVAIYGFWLWLDKRIEAHRLKALARKTEQIQKTLVTVEAEKRIANPDLPNASRDPSVNAEIIRQETGAGRCERG